MKKLMLCLLLAVSGGITQAQKVTVSLAGISAGFNGDGNVGYLTEMQEPDDVTVDAAGNIYFVDGDNHLVRKISIANGLVTTIAGGGTATADGVPATSAVLAPKYMCMDAAGNIYITTANKIREINASTGTISTIAGLDTSGYNGDGIPAATALLNVPCGICIDAANNLYFADSANQRIRKITASTGYISTIGGNGVAGHSGDGGAATSANIFDPVAICIDGAGNVFFSDQVAIYIRKISPGGIMSVVAGDGTIMASGDGGLAVDAGIGTIFGMCVDDSDNIYINDQSCSCRKISKATGRINIVAGEISNSGYNGDGMNSLVTYFSSPYGIHVDHAGNIYVADHGNNRVRKAISLQHTPKFVYGRGQTIKPCPATPTDFSMQMAITDLDSAQTETWSVITAPLHGTLSGFPSSVSSIGKAGVVTPPGTIYTPGAGFSGNDFFTVRVTDGGLSDTMMVYVSVPVSAPSAGTITPLYDTICAYQSTMCTETVSGGIWGTPGYDNYIIGGMFIGNVAGLDTITYMVTDGCVMSTSTYVYVRTLPDAGIITGSDTAYVGYTTALADTAVGGVWSSSDITIATVSSTGVVTGVAPGIVSIMYDVSDTVCTGTAGTVFWVVGGSPLIVNTVNGNDKMVIAPNPSNGRFNINITSKVDEQVTITITNIMGQEVKKISCATNSLIQAELNVPAGVYLLNATGTHIKLTDKIVVE